ncbi:MAG: cell division protein FtsA [Candidatus Latescibacterota bacterium]|nr:cell division protein FtsA [Candidatus Latescibacterota bacterium]
MSSPVVVLDIGTSKVLCLVGEADQVEGLKILGIGHSDCRGIRRSAVIDMPGVVESIRNSVIEAERSAGLRITGAYLGIAGSGIRAQTSRSAVAISGAGNPIDENDVERALAAAEEAAPPADTNVLHRFVQSYAVDGEPVQNPLWLHGDRLEVETLTTSASNHACTTLRKAAEEAGIGIVGFILESLAAATSLLSTDEREMGVGILDIGAGTCDLAIFHDTLRHIAEIPLGAQDVTRDLSLVLNISPREAEELKCSHGGVCTNEESSDECIEFRTTAGRSHTIPLQQLHAIIEARQQEIFEFVAHDIEASGLGQQMAAGVVLTGGGALLDNVERLGEEVLGLPVRVGIPGDIVSASSVGDPRYTAAVGLLRFATNNAGDLRAAIENAPSRDRWMDKVARLFSFL